MFKFYLSYASPIFKPLCCYSALWSFSELLTFKPPMVLPTRLHCTFSKQWAVTTTQLQFTQKLLSPWQRWTTGNNSTPESSLHANNWLSFLLIHTFVACIRLKNQQDAKICSAHIAWVISSLPMFLDIIHNSTFL